MSEQMRNVIGNPVEGNDFFNRPKEVGRLERELANAANLLLVAPRRVGKTSLVLRILERARAGGKKAVSLNVEGCSDELGFAEQLVLELERQGLHPDILKRVSLVFQSCRKSLSGAKVGAGGLDVALGDGADPDLGTLKKALESIFRKIDEGDADLLIAIDEMPELLLAMGKEEEGAIRVGRFLHWLRSLRQTHRHRIRWIFLGSIGLDSFVDDRDLRKTINDLTTLSLDALEPEEADRFLEILGIGNGLPLLPDVRTAIIQRVGWPLPHHLQLMFHAMRDAEVKAADVEAVGNAFAELTKPQNSSQFDTWRQRLNDQFSLEDAKAAKALLRHLCQHPEGRTRAQIFDALMAKTPAADSDAMEERLAKLLPVLQRDGYLLEKEGRYAFRSFLLREYWFRREVK